MMFDLMKEINSVKTGLQIKPGDVIIENIAGTGADIIATSEL